MGSVEAAKAYLMKANAEGLSLYDHLAEVVSKLLAEKPEDALEQIEAMVEKINGDFPDSVRLIKPYDETPAKRLAYFGTGSLYLNTSVRTGLDWSPFEFVMCSEKQMAPLCVSGCTLYLFV